MTDLANRCHSVTIATKNMHSNQTDVNPGVYDNTKCKAYMFTKYIAYIWFIPVNMTNFASVLFCWYLLLVAAQNYVSPWITCRFHTYSYVLKSQPICFWMKRIIDYCEDIKHGLSSLAKLMCHVSGRKVFYTFFSIYQPLWEQSFIGSK